MPDAARWREPTSRTFARLHGDVVAAAHLFHSLGEGRADTVALLSPNCDELITATLASQLAGVAAPVNPGSVPSTSARCWAAPAPAWSSARDRNCTRQHTH
jgi:acyl-CoA synthetase (AMP-forming)/AMP-acid ligase II